MKKILLFSLMGLLMLGSFTSCKKDKNEKYYKEKIVGKWKSYSNNGQQALTDSKVVDTYYDDATVKTTVFSYGQWSCSQGCTYKIEGNKYSKVGVLGDVTATIASITDSYLTFKNWALPNGMSADEYVFERVTVDYSNSFVGLWEGIEMTGDDTHGAADHRWKYNADGTYVYFFKNDEGQWVADPDNLESVYYVDGNFFGSRWVKDGTAYRECWDIEYCNDTEMKWSALRERADGSRFTATMTMKRVSE